MRYCRKGGMFAISENARTVSPIPAPRIPRSVPCWARRRSTGQYTAFRSIPKACGRAAKLLAHDLHQRPWRDTGSTCRFCHLNGDNLGKRLFVAPALPFAIQSHGDVLAFDADRGAAAAGLLGQERGKGAGPFFLGDRGDHVAMYGRG